MKNFKLILLSVFGFAMAGCYTVVKESKTYYSEFSTEKQTEQSAPVEDTTATEESGVADQKESGDYDSDHVIVHNYYNYDPWYSPWYGPTWYHPGWTIGISYTWGYPDCDPWYGCYPSSYYYWGGCNYPVVYGGGYYPYYPVPWWGHTNRTSSARNYGMRRYATNQVNPAFPGIYSGTNVTAGAIGGGRAYKTDASGATKEKSATGQKTYRKTQRKTKTHGTGVVEQKKKSSGERKYKNSSGDNGRFKEKFRSGGSGSKSSSHGSSTGGRSFKGGGGGKSGGGSSAPRVSRKFKS